MYNIIPLIFILLSLLTIIFIVVRRFSELASIDIDTIPEEKASKMKEQIITNRLKRNYYKWLNVTKKVFVPVASFSSDAFKKGYNKLLEVKEASQEKKAEVEFTEVIKDNILEEAKNLIKSADWGDAEKKLIEIISRDPKNAQAFKQLGKVYFERKDYSEAKQALEHVTKLVEKDIDSLYISKDDLASPDKKKQDDLKILLSGLFYDLSLVYEAMDDYANALENIRKALKIEPANPRYLDTKLEISIMKKDRISAEKALQRIKESNPDNQKLEEWEEKINNI